MKKKIAILMTVYNRKDMTVECLSRLDNQVNGQSFDIYLTDDGCTDGTADAISEQWPGIHIIKGDGSLFWNRGMWTAWSEAAKLDYYYYLWLNDDTMVYPYMLYELLSASNSKNDEAIIIGPTQDTKHQKTTYGGFLQKGGFVPVDGRLNQIRYFNGNIVLIPRKVFLKLGNLDYHYLHSKGDFDYGLRACEQGICSYQVGRYLGECEEHPDLDKWCNPKFAFRDRWRAMMRPNGMPPGEVFYFAKKHTGILTAPLHAFSVILRCCFPWLWT